ncbi:MAG: restriction endonuclease subunit S [Solirubrobacteraceae bacterium]
MYLTDKGLRESAASLAKPGQILLVTRTGVGKVAVSPCALSYSQDITAISEDRGRVARDYLVHYLKSRQTWLVDRARGATIKGVTRDVVRRMPIPLPPLDEQRRLAAVLDGAASVASSARRTTELVDELQVSAFAQAVGIDQGSETVLVEELVDHGHGGIRTGPFGSQLLHSEFVDAGVQVLGIDNAVSNEFRWGGRRFITEGKYAALKRYTVNPGDVLITIMGTCGRVAVVPDDIGVAINTKHLCCITLDHRRCLPEFLQAYFLHHPEAQRYLRSRAKGAIMDGLNMGIIKALPVILPPISSQAELVRRLAEMDATRERMRDRNVTMGRLTAALTQRAFAGEL